MSNKYLYKRNDIYYFSKRINGKPIKISLKSSNIKHCRIIRDKILESIEMNKLEKEIIDNVIKSLWKDKQDLINKHLELGHKTSNSITQEEFKKNRELQRKLPKLISAEKDTLLKQINKLEKLEENEHNIEEQFKSLEKKLLEKISFSENTDIDNNDIYNNLDKYYNDYINHKKSFNKISKSSIKSYNASLNYLKYFTNKDSVLNFSFFKDLQQKFQQIPLNFFKYKKYTSKTFEEILELKKIDDYDTLNNKTINNHITNLKLFFDYLEYEEIIKENPLVNIKSLIESKEIRKEEYTQTELNEIFNSNMEIEYINMCKIVLYTGFRIEELLSVKKENIKDNFIHIDLKDTNNKKHNRIIPIHQNIIDIIAYQNKKNLGEYLFFNGESEVGNVGKRVNRRLKDVVNNKDKSFHSLRKNFAQEIEMNTNGEDKIKKYLIGHSLDKDITHKVYNRGKINTEKLIDCINQITFNY